ncbi:neuromedin-S isoform X2 [Patagioenas fasciata]|uniref:neuromedin-S isoform X2 n=1 Tax=Patagioenas fasciata TaxID=372321 RepID=UPI003A99CEE1
MPPPALHWLLAACCLCALPRGSGFPQPYSRSRDGVDLPKSQISSTVLDLCYSIFNSMRTNEESQIATAKFTKKDRKGTLGRPFFLFRPRNGRTIENGGSVRRSFHPLQNDRNGTEMTKFENRGCKLHLEHKS